MTLEKIARSVKATLKTVGGGSAGVVNQEYIVFNWKGIHGLVIPGKKDYEINIWVDWDGGAIQHVDDPEKISEVIVPLLYGFQDGELPNGARWRTDL